MDKTAVIILHYKSDEDTLECLTSLSTGHRHMHNLRTIVVCNSSLHQLRQSIKKIPLQIELLDNQQNLGFAQGVNVGIQRLLHQGYNYFVVLNNDTIIKDNLLERLVNFTKSDDAIGLVSPKIYFAPGFEFHKERYKKEEKGKVIWYAGGILDWNNIYASHRGVDQVDDKQYEKTIDTDFVTGCCMLVRKEVIEKIGLLNEKYFLYFEDIDFSQRAKQAGFRIIYFPKAYLWHKNASSSGKPGSSIHIYYQSRNRLYFGYKYASLRTKKALLLDSLRLFLKGGMYRKAVADYYLGRMGKGSI